MTASEVPAVRRPRPPLIAILRILLPAVAGAVLLAVIVAVASSGLRNIAGAASTTRPIELVGPRLIGADSKQRPFVITATSAEREDGSGRIRLNSPVLMRDQGGADEMRVTAAKGVYDETAGRLELTGDVRLAGPSGAFATPSAVYDAKSGEVLGAGGVKAASGANQLQAGSVSVKDKGKSVIYKGGVHTRLNVK
ncbi:LPS export ABC transporter periplasmic protein LptC [Phenylobacterium sp. LjRoot225]|uniref:LPS export ABC transporter periplasmic protein LptC n=1 Tax=Phenylobacterium sp. LjRoot225 TaxID=3342285 RepID=UPI003ECD406B